ncbi:MAG: hypothetical protein OXC55_00745 [Chloroflexi bacterium]|nr:hypothetical protein [Chloroflexota bacterium]
MVSYDWIELRTPADYDLLIEVLDPEFDPKGIAQRLKTQFTPATKGILVEHGYVDKDYRSTFYSFYAKMARPYRPDCVRLHFFDGTVWYDEHRTDIACSDLRPQDHYFGYIVLRPTMEATLGRSLLSPDMRLGARGRAIQSIHHANVLGHRLPIWGFPSMTQHVDIAVCAHVCCWAILRYYSETYPKHKEYLLHDITKLAAPFDPGGIVPSLGINVFEAERVFQTADCFPLLVGRRNSSSDEAFFSQFLAYLESGFPLFVEIPSKEHAVVAVGHNWKQSAVPPPASSSHVWTQVETLLTVDDNLLPYASIPLEASPNAAHQPPYAANQFNSFIVALPDKIFYPADAIGVTCQAVKRALESSRDPDLEPLELERYFITTVSKLREHAREYQSLLGDSLVGLLMHLKTAQYVWVIEYCSVRQWQSGHIAARAIVDATASSTDKMPIWVLHDEEVAHVFDRTSAETQPTSIQLSRATHGPLPRMELNLRPVVESYAPTGTSEGGTVTGEDE